MFGNYYCVDAMYHLLSLSIYNGIRTIITYIYYIYRNSLMRMYFLLSLPIFLQIYSGMICVCASGRTSQQSKVHEILQSTQVMYNHFHWKKRITLHSSVHDGHLWEGTSIFSSLRLCFKLFLVLENSTHPLPTIFSGERVGP